jgi:outer membrane receptor protein involved in Fe transport
MKSRLSVAAYVRNLTNKVYISGSDNQLPSFAGVVTYLYGEPRMFAVELRYDF